MSVTLEFKLFKPLTITLINDHSVKINDWIFTSKQLDDLDKDERDSYDCHIQNGNSHEISLLLASIFSIGEVVDHVLQDGYDGVLGLIIDTIIIRLSKGLPCNSAYYITPEHLTFNDQKRKFPTTGTDLMSWDFNKTLAP
jgi:hypothetical protein